RQAQEGPQGDRSDLQEPHRRLQPAALYHRQGQGEPAPRLLLHQRRRRHPGDALRQLEDRVHGAALSRNDAGLGGAVHAAARAQALQPAHRSVRIRRPDVEQLLRVVHLPRLLHPRGADRGGHVRGDVQGLPVDPEGRQLHDRRRHRQDVGCDRRRELTPACGMTEAAPIGPIFERGPFHRLVAVFGGAGEHAIARAAIGLAVVAWLPLLLIAPLAAGGAGSPGQQVRGVVADYAALARYLVALPLLVVADRIVGARLTGIARCFVESGLVPAESHARFDALLASTRAWCGSGWAAIFIAAFVALLVAALHEAMPVELVPAWRRGPEGRALNPAGWWHLVVSVPLLLFL